MERVLPIKRIVTRSLQRYWRLTRGLTLGAQGAVIDAEGRFLLIRHTYRPGWHFPGGGVERNETALLAMTRELREEAGVIVGAGPELFGLYANFQAFPGDHIALFVVRDWQQPVPPKPNHEIAEHGFFTVDACPDKIHPSTRQRMLEILGHAEPSVDW
ncbi:MAG: NUDIX domain-containing protein [Hyphomicrobiaceae bacterium]|nr:NUDIX domain-containing protein [Hyphomicrobiaceae bacterium]